MKIKVLAIIERDGDGFHAYCPAFRGLHVDGSSKDGALQNTIEALKLYMDSPDRIALWRRTVLASTITRLWEEPFLKASRFRGDHPTLRMEPSLMT